MTRFIRNAAAVATFAVVGLTMAGVAAAQDTDYPPEQCTAQVNGVETVVSCDTGTEAAAVESAVVAQAVDPAGTLPYTGSDSTVPLAEAGVALLAAGGAVVLVMKRRQATQA
jgi:LPXTG-motif cell wall-anchored protein